MIQLTPPNCDLSRVRILTRRLSSTNADSLWERSSGRYKAFKEEITKELLKIQGHRCAYCGCHLFGNPHRDHIAPKSPYYMWTFWPKNLVLSCSPCNVDFKKSFDPVIPTVNIKSYKQTAFSFVHPYFDDPKQHIKFLGHRLEILISRANSSTKGKTSIDLFDLTNTHRAKERAMHAAFSRDVGYLQGRWKRLAEQVVLAPIPRKLILSKFG